MDKPTQPEGNLIAWTNRYKKAGDNRPTFDGHITKPGSTDEMPIAVWARHYTDKKTGESKIMFTGTVGRVAANAPAIDKIAALIAETPAADLTLGSITVAPGQFVAFPNAFKDEAPEKNRADFWGPINFGDGTPVVRLAIWLHEKDKNGNPFISGTTSFPIPGRSEREQADSPPDLADLLDNGTVTKGIAKGKGRKGEVAPEPS